jgi:hypothetical protein
MKELKRFVFMRFFRHGFIHGPALKDASSIALVAGVNKSFVNTGTSRGNSPDALNLRKVSSMLGGTASAALSPGAYVTHVSRWSR